MRRQNVLRSLWRQWSPTAVILMSHNNQVCVVHSLWCRCGWAGPSQAWAGPSHARLESQGLAQRADVTCYCMWPEWGRVCKPEKGVGWAVSQPEGSAGFGEGSGSGWLSVASGSWREWTVTPKEGKDSGLRCVQLLLSRRGGWVWLKGGSLE